MNPRHRRSPLNQTLNNAYPDWISGGGVISSLEDPPWYGNVDSSSLDLAYHGEHSGGKFIAPLVYHFLDADSGEITDDGKSKIAGALKARFYMKWLHLWGVYMSEYDPLNTYNMTETGHREGGSSGSGTETETLNTQVAETIDETVQSTGKDTDTKNLTSTETIDEDTTSSGSTTGSTVHGHVIDTSGTDSQNTTNTVWGFNTPTDTAVPHDSQSRTGENQSTETHSGTDTTSSASSDTGTRDVTDTTTQTGTDTIDRTNKTDTDADNVTTTTGTNTNQSTESENYFENYSNEKKGTMYRAPGELLSLDRDFWLVDYFSIVFADIDSLLTLAVYPERRVRNIIYKEEQ